MSFSWPMILGTLVFLSFIMKLWSGTWYKKSLRYGYLAIACLLAFYTTLFVALIIQKNATGASGIFVIGAAIILNETQKVISVKRRNESLHNRIKEFSSVKDLTTQEV